MKKSKKKGIFIKTNCRELPVDERNLVYKAVNLLRKKYEFGGVEIYIYKNIPLAAGLGGGSSNAAAVLKGVNKLWKLGIPDARLKKIAAGIGSDVSFFVSGYGSALGGGRGEILKPLKLPRYWFLLVLPDLKVASKDAYDGLQLSLTRKAKSVNMLLRALEGKDLTQIAKELYNRLEETVMIRSPLIKKIKNILKTAGCKAVLMSGSGPVVFALTVTRKEAIEAEKHLRLYGWRTKMVRSL